MLFTLAHSGTCVLGSLNPTMAARILSAFSESKSLATSKMFPFRINIKETYSVAIKWQLDKQRFDQ